MRSFYHVSQKVEPIVGTHQKLCFRVIQQTTDRTEIQMGCIIAVQVAGTLVQTVQQVAPRTEPDITPDIEQTVDTIIIGIIAGRQRG